MDLLFEDPTLLLVVVAAAAVGAFLALPRYRFVVRIEGGFPRLSKGTVSGAFLDEVADACRRHGLTTGWIGGSRKGRRISLAFSGNIPNECRQQLRNVWQFTK